MSIKSVAIVGGGIGGLATANALLRLGLSVSLYERAPSFVSNVGAGFSLQPNGQSVLAHMGFDKEIRKIIHPFHTWMMVDKKGQMVGWSDKIKAFGDRLGFFLGGTARADLIDILAAPLQHTGSLNYSHNVTHIEQDSEGVTLQFEKQSPIRADIVVGADGIHSIVVDKIFPRSLPPVFSNESIFYGIIDNVSHLSFKSPLIGRPNTLVSCLSQGEFIMFPIGNKNQLVWAATYRSKKPPSKGDLEWTISNNKQEINHILERYLDSHPIHECVPHSNRILHFGMFYREHSKEWHRGRVCLLGDACHASLPYMGQGANMAIEDGFMLALSLEKHNFHPEPAFSEYFHKRFKRTKKMVDSARYLGKFLHSENPLVDTVRKVLLPRAMNSDMVMRSFEKEFYNNCPVPVVRKG